MHLEIKQYEINISLPVWQYGPVQPVVQVQVGMPDCKQQEPPFEQGFGTQLLVAI